MPDLKNWLTRLLPGVQAEAPTDPVQLSMARSGYVRQKAVRELGRMRSAEALGAILPRLNDWVPEVRVAALEVLEPYLAAEHVSLFLACLDQVIALQDWHRSDHSVVMQRIRDLLASDTVRPEVLRSFSLCIGKRARFLFRVLRGDGSAVDEALLRAAAKHPDFILRAEAVALCSEQWPASGAVLAHLAADAQAGVRRDALQVYWHVLDAPERHVAMIGGLNDPSPAVREYAMWCARQIEFDLRAFFRDRIAQRPVVEQDWIVVLGLLSSLGMREHIDLADEALLSSSTSVRRAALAASVVLDRDSADQCVAQALADPSRKLARLARRYVSKGSVVLSHDQFLAAVRAATLRGDTRQALAISRMMPTWSRLESLLTCLTLTKDQWRVCAAVKVWESEQSRSCFTKPDAAECERLSALMRDPKVRKAFVADRELVFAFRFIGIWSGPDSSTGDVAKA